MGKSGGKQRVRHTLCFLGLTLALNQPQMTDLFFFNTIIINIIRIIINNSFTISYKNHSKNILFQQLLQTVAFSLSLQVDGHIFTVGVVSELSVTTSFPFHSMHFSSLPMAFPPIFWNKPPIICLWLPRNFLSYLKCIKMYFLAFLVALYLQLCK